MKIEADVSLYPLGEEKVAYPVHNFWEGLEKQGCVLMMKVNNACPL